MKTFNDALIIGTTTLKFLAELDAKIYRGFGYVQSRLHLYKLARLLSFTGDGYLYVVIAVIACLFIPPTGTYFLIAVILGGLIEIPVYAEQVHTPSDEFSFPSGHATAGFMMAYITSHFFPDTAQFVYIWASLIGLSRVLLRVHFVSDIIAGMFLGTGLATLTLWLLSLFAELPEMA